MPKRKPKCVPIIDFEGNYAVDAFFAKLSGKRPSKEPKTPGAAYRKPPEPPPEEAKPVRRHSPLADERPRGKPTRSQEKPT
jgi:hypothetical protein